jgi:hypothetical protein
MTATWSSDIARPVSRSVYPPPIASAELSRHVEKVVGYSPLVEMDDQQRREFREAVLEAEALLMIGSFPAAGVT